MNLLEYTPQNIPYYNADLHTNYFLEYYKKDVSKILFNKEEKLFSLIADSSLLEIYVENVFTDDFYDNLLFNKLTNSKTVLSELYEIITSNKDSSLIVKSKKINTKIDEPINISMPIFLTETICNWLINSINEVYENNESIIKFVNSIKLLILDKLKIIDKKLYYFENIKIVNSKIEDECNYENSLKFQIVLSGTNCGNLILHNNEKMIFNTDDIYLNGIITHFPI
jgi:hypothetical protein